jgi:hypothetical protein
MAMMTQIPDDIQNDDPWPEMAVAPRTARQAWCAKVQQIAERARQTLPACNGRIDAAVKMVLAGDVELLPDGHARVQSQSKGETVYRLVNGACNCKDFEHAPSHWCKHRIAAGIAKRAGLPPVAPAHEPPPQDETHAAEPMQGIDPKWITHIQGRPFIRFEGLLSMAYERGLVELTTTVVMVTATLAVCQSTARFTDGLVVTDIGDASPENVAKHLRPHFVRMSATRASARALRRALNIAACSVEELGDGE